MPHLLLLEPDHVLGKTYAHTLEQAGYTVTWTQTAQGGIHAMDKRQADLIILELQLPKHNGIEFLYELRSYSDWLRVPVVLLSHVGPSIMDNTILREQLGVARYLHKSSTKLVDLLTAINRVFGAA